MSKNDRSTDTNVHKALSTPARKQLLSLIEVGGPIDLKSLTAATGMKETTLRHHLMVLERAGLIVSEEGYEGGPGRPPLVYRIALKHWDLGFPPRQYAMLADKLLERLLEEDGIEAAREFMARIGSESARHILEEALAAKGSDQLEISDIQDRVVPALAGLGSAAAVTQASDSRVSVRMNNCIFYELAVAHREVVCRGHGAFFETIAEALGDGYSVTSDACLAAGDECCISTIFLAEAGEAEPEK